MIVLIIIFLGMACYIDKKRSNYYHHLSSKKSCQKQKGMV